MKIFKHILMIILSIISIPCAILMTTGCIWYTLPMIQTTKLGLLITNNIPNTGIFWVTIGCAIGYFVIIVLEKIFNSGSAKWKNLFVHLNTWLISILAISLSVYTFATCTELVSESIKITATRKIGIAVSLLALLLYIMFAGKLSKIVNRRIQAYEDSKEMNIVGRSSVIFTNILKLIEILFPEIIVLTMISFCVSFNISSYFIVIICACVIPMIGNIEADLNTRAEIKRKKEIESDLLAEKIANNMR